MKRIKFCSWCFIAILFVMSTSVALGKRIETSISEPAFVTIQKIHTDTDNDTWNY